ncbi:adenine DNA glycosylase [Ambystoma mexicanum]|uniref:adenine DNA glycosylase n=1 Tax=Ambystoma mexicanum TaxID=8296 RepID=UPI0037E96C17
MKKARSLSRGTRKKMPAHEEEMEPLEVQEGDSVAVREIHRLISSYHSFGDEDVATFRKNLLSWYDQCKRDLPWRKLASEEADLNKRGYAVWVSEIMLQQTQVSTVIAYYNNWMKKWPTLQDLSRASLEEVNELWAGLGYYSRGKRLHEGAQKVVSEYKGQMPHTAVDLQKLLPGVGRYTAGAIASIAYGQVTGVVDGNVIRVLCRARSIGADSGSPTVTDGLWHLANSLVDPHRPGDFNQAIMELGAMVCTPKVPLCAECPIKSLCRAYRQVEKEQATAFQRLMGKPTPKLNQSADIEECVANGQKCSLCLPPLDSWDSSLGVMNFPRKSAKKQSRVEQTLTCVLERKRESGEPEYLIVQRPTSGLLAGMWEFPSSLLETDLLLRKQEQALCKHLSTLSGITTSSTDLQRVGEVVHIFSHIHQTYLVYSLYVEKAQSALVKQEGPQLQPSRWVTMAEFHKSAVSTAMKKVLKMYENKNSAKMDTGKGNKRKRSPKAEAKSSPQLDRQLTLNKFFKPAP